MKTFNKKKKEEVLEIAQQHQNLDRFVQGSWLKEGSQVGGIFKGCFFGCMTQTEDNTLLEASKQLQLPLWLVYVAERIFEGLPEGESLNFPVELLKAIPINSNLNQKYKDWNIEVLTPQLQFVEEGSEQYSAIVGCINLFKLDIISESAAWSAAGSARLAAESAESAAGSARLAAESARLAAWSAARLAAESARLAAESAELAAESVAWSAAGSTRSAAGSAEWSAESAAESAELAAESVAWSAAGSTRSAAGSAVRSAARSNYYMYLRDILIKVLKS